MDSTVTTVAFATTTAVAAGVTTIAMAARVTTTAATGVKRTLLTIRARARLRAAP
jgi:hypothetical protein